MTAISNLFQIGDYARSVETGWLGKIVAFKDRDGERFAKMIGVDVIAGLVGGLSIEESLSYDDVQWFVLDDLVPFGRKAS
jgi:hypothetical protein